MNITDEDFKRALKSAIRSGRVVAKVYGRPVYLRPEAAIMRITRNALADVKFYAT